MLVGKAAVHLDKPGQIRDKNLMRIMGLDVGSHTIGVAISDGLGLTAQALKTIQRRSLERDVEELD